MKLHLEYDEEALKIILLQRYFYPEVLHKSEFNDYEIYTILDNGEPKVIIEEL